MDLFDDDDAFTFPRELATLDGVPDEFVGIYIETDDGFRLHPDVATEVEACEAHLATLEAEHDAEMAEIRESSARLRAQTLDLVKSSQVKAALAGAGVAAGLVNAAAAYLVKELDLVVETDDGDFAVALEGPYGTTSVSHAVECWLQTEDGLAYRPAVPAPGAGRFSQQIADLRRTLH
jgi:hypothetical protein